MSETLTEETKAHHKARARFTVVVDIVFARWTPRYGTEVLLIKRAYPPFQNHWALPGGFVDDGEQVEDAAIREGTEETTLVPRKVQLVGIVPTPPLDDPGRDPRGFNLHVAYFCDDFRGEAKGADDAAEAWWFTMEELARTNLAFNHGAVIAAARRFF